MQRRWKKKKKRENRVSRAAKVCSLSRLQPQPAIDDDYLFRNSQSSKYKLNSSFHITHPFTQPITPQSLSLQSYADVPLTPGISTSSFLEATEGVTKLFDLLGSTAFSVVKNDMEGNLKKIRERFLATPDLSSTLQDLVRNEGKPGDKKRVATEGLLWLLR